VALVGRKGVYETGGQNAALVQSTGSEIVQLDGIGFAIGAPARGESAGRTAAIDAVARNAQR
jgi:hypothetical protein